MNIKQWVRRWLEIPPPVTPVMVLRDDIADTTMLNARLKFALGQWEDARREIADMNSKFDVLADALGIAIVADPLEMKGASITSTREDGLAGRAREYIDAVRAVVRVLDGQQRIFTGYVLESRAALDRLRKKVGA